MFTSPFQGESPILAMLSQGSVRRGGRNPGLFSFAPPELVSKFNSRRTWERDLILPVVVSVWAWAVF